MRIWHQSLTDLTLLPAYRTMLERHIADVSPEGVVVDVHGVVPGTYPTRYPGKRIQQVYMQSLHKEQFVSAALQAEATGYDGMIIATIPDLALEECRSLVDIPVIGFGEASLHIAGFLGAPAGVISFDAHNLEPQLRRNAQRYGLEPLLGPVVPVSMSFDDVVDALEAQSSDHVLPALHAAFEKVVSLGAKAIIPGPGPLNLLVARQGLHRFTDVPIIDSFRVSIEMCAVMARIRLETDVYACRSGFYYARPEKDQISQARSVYGLDTATAQAGVASRVGDSR